MQFSRILLMAVCASALVGSFAGCGDQRSERKGGQEIPDLTAGSAVSSALGGAQSSDSGATGVADSGAAGLAESGAAGLADSGGEGGEGGAAGGVVSDGPVRWCDAYRVINCVCQQCHQDPTLNGAAMPLLSYENTQAGYPKPTSEAVWKQMQRAVNSGFMPFSGDPSVMPRVLPLTPEQKSTLLTWLNEGAHDEGGTDCPLSCDWSDGTPEL